MYVRSVAKSNEKLNGPNHEIYFDENFGINFFENHGCKKSGYVKSIVKFPLPWDLLLHLLNFVKNFLENLVENFPKNFDE